MFQLLLKAIYFILPAYVANMFPVFARALKLPGGRVISQKWFGGHKTYRGFTAGIIGGILTVYLQLYLSNYNFFKNISLLDYSAVNLIFLGFLFGFGAMLGDLIKSFFKRRIGKQPGVPWPGFDQLDFIAGALILVSVVYLPELKIIVTILVVTPVLHLLTNVIGYWLGWKKVWW